MNNRLKILFTITNFDTSGSGKVVYDIVKNLDKKLFDPEICCFHKHGDFYQSIAELGIRVHVFEFTTPYRPYISLPFRIFRIARFFKSQKFDIIHSWHWSSDITEPLAAKLAGIHFVYTKKSMGWGNKSWLWRTKLSTKVIAINQDMLTRFFKYSKNVAYIPLGVDTDFFKPQDSSLDLRNKIKIDNGSHLVITVANLVAVKGIEILIKAVKELSNYSITTLIIGNTKSDYAKNLMEEYEDPSILFLGHYNDVRPYLNNADIFVIPTLDRGEGLPVAPLEAMASECVVIGSNVPGVKDILNEHIEFLFKSGDFYLLARKIEKLIKNKKELSNISKRMRKTVIEKYSLKQFVDSLTELYINVSGYKEIESADN